MVGVDHIFWVCGRFGGVGDYCGGVRVYVDGLG